MNEKENLNRINKRKEAMRRNRQNDQNIKSDNVKNTNMPLTKRLGCLGILVFCVLFLISIPTMYAEMKKSDAEKKIDKTLSKDEKHDLAMYIEKAEDLTDDEQYKKAYNNVQKALDINKESTAAKEIEEVLLPHMDEFQKSKDAKLIKSAEKMAKEYYFEKAIKQLETVKPTLKYSKEDNPQYNEARNCMNDILLDKGKYLESVGRENEAIAIYNRMDINAGGYMKGQERIIDIEMANEEAHKIKDDSPGFFSKLFNSFKKTGEEKAADAAEKKAKEAQKQANEATAFQNKIDNAKTVDYEEIERAPGRFKDTPVYIEGEVYDIQEINGKTLISMTAYDDYGEKHSVVALYHDKTRIQEGDYISIYADVLGGYAQYKNKISDYLDAPYYIYYERGSTFYQAPVVEIFYMNANGVIYK